MKNLNLKMELLNSEEMEGITGGAGSVLACTANAKVISCQTVEASCPGGRVVYPGCNGIDKFGYNCIPEFKLKCIENKVIREDSAIALAPLSFSAASTASGANVVAAIF